MRIEMPQSISSTQSIFSFLTRYIANFTCKKKPDSIVRYRSPKIGLALSSGGAKSLAHIGVLQVLEEHKIPIHAISGSSMGAYVGSLWATNHSAEEMIQLAAEMHDPKTMRKLADPVIPPVRGVFYGNKVKAQLARSIKNATFSDVSRKLLVVAANLDTYERIVFREGSILNAVHASCAMPGIIVPVEIDGMRCTDGGVVDPVPVGALKKFTDVDHIIAVNTIPSIPDIDTHREAQAIAESEVEIEHDSWWQRTIDSLGNKINPAAKGNMIDNLRRSLRASQIRMAHDSCLRAKVVIRPVAHGSHWHEYHHFENFINLGRRETLKALPDILNLLNPIIINDNETTDKPLVGKRVA